MDLEQPKCTQCGLCSEVCATFQVTHWEHESPRGRIRLADDLLKGKISPQAKVLDTFDHCLGCGACERACPLDVQYSKIRAMAQNLRIVPQASVSQETYRGWIRTAYRMGSSFWRTYGRQWLALPNAEIKPRVAMKKMFKSTGSLTLVIGCLQELLHPDVIRQTIQFLEIGGYKVYVDPKQPCCGAVFDRLTQGAESICYPEEREHACRLQKKRRENFLDWLSSDSYFLSLGCHCSIQSGKDIYMFIREEIEKRKLKLEMKTPLTVYYQPYCGQAQDSVLQLLKMIHHLTIYPSPACCGGYGGETFWHPEHAQDLLTFKKQQIPAGSTIVVGSPECAIQFQKAGFRVRYPIEILSLAIHLISR